MKKDKKKGFTLIELLAVIIILGVLMLIAIPSVTEYINNSRKSAFLDSASGFVSAVAIKVNDAENSGMNFSNSNIAYYVAVSNDSTGSCISLEKGGKSPFGNWANTPAEVSTANNTGGKAYVVVIPNAAGTSYSYYFTAKDTAGYGITPVDVSKATKADVITTAVTFPVTANLTVASTVFPNLPGAARSLTAQYVTPATSCH